MIPQDRTALNYERGRRAGGNAERDSVRVHGGQYIDSTGVLVGCPNEYLTDESLLGVRILGFLARHATFLRKLVPTVLNLAWSGGYRVKPTCEMDDLSECSNLATPLSEH